MSSTTTNKEQEAMRLNIFVWIPKQLRRNERIYNSLWGLATRTFNYFYRIYCLFKYHYADFFRLVAIEISTECNRRCYYCPNAIHGTPKEYMPEELFKKIICDLHSINYTGGVTFHLFGEPLMDKRLVGFVRYVKEKLPNAMLLTSA